MPKTITSPDAAAPFYRSGVASGAQKWLAKTLAATGVADAAKSDAAENRYAQKVGAAIQNKTRQKKLQRVTDADIKAGVSAVGASGYSQAASAKTDKWAKNWRPVASVLQTLVNSLPEKVADARTNAAQRVGHIAGGLQDAKNAGQF